MMNIEYKGYQIQVTGLMTCYSCPALKLYGYATEQAIKRAITKKIGS
jgi:hypothetical protein